MNSKALTILTLIPTFILGGLLSVAGATPRSQAPEQDDRNATSERPENTSTTPEVNLQLAWYHREPEAADSFAILADNEIFIVELEGDSHAGSLSVYDARGNFIVGYAGTSAGLVVFDDQGLVEQTREDALVTSLVDYSSAITAVTNPLLLVEFLEISGVVWGDEPAGHPLAWAIAGFLARCIDVSATFNGDGEVEQVTVTWDC